jgi:predicted molibdopterin-dependent oxidoreductase YjgC
LQHGKRLIVVDAGKNSFEAFTNCSIKPAAGSELAFINGIKAAVVKLGLNKTPYFGDPGIDLADQAEKCGVATDLMLEAAFNFAGADNPVVIYETAAVKDSTLLNALIGLAELSGASLFNPKGAANTLIAAQYGLDKPFALNGHQAAYVILGDDQPTENLVKKLEEAPFLIVQASHVSSLTAKADIVFPVESWLEQEGHYLSADGQLQTAQKSLPTPQNVWSNQAVLVKMADLLNITVDSQWKNELLKRVSPVEINI